MKFIIAGFVSLIFICSANHASAEYLKRDDVHHQSFWNKVGVYQLTEVLTNDVRWYPGKDYSGARDFPEFRCFEGAIECSALRGQYDREYSEWSDAKERAYSCYRYGKGCDVCYRPVTSPGGGCTETKPPQHPFPTTEVAVEEEL